MSKNYNQFIDLLSTYSYGPAYELLIEACHKDSDIAILTRAFKHSINFDFDFAIKVLHSTSAKFKHTDLYKEVRKSLEDLIAGKPEAIFSELMFSMITQANKDEYIDFTGRIYRYREAILKYLFLTKEGKKNINMLSEEMSKRYQIKILKEKYNMHTNNLGVAITKYLKQRHGNDHDVKRILEVLDSEKMIDLMNLRNGSIIGHGFVGISRRDIMECYGDTDELLYDFKMCIGFLGMHLSYEKYDKWNNDIVIESKKLENFLENN